MMTGIRSFARIKSLFDWDEEAKSIKVHGHSIGVVPYYNPIITRPIVNFFEFDRVFNAQSTNQDIFHQIVEPLCGNAVNTEDTPGDSVFVCHGDSRTVLGTFPDQTIPGVLLLSTEYLLRNENIQRIESIDIQVIESYGVESSHLTNTQHVENIEFYRESSESKRNLIGNVAFMHKILATKRSQSNTGMVAYILDITRTDQHHVKVMIIDSADDGIGDEDCGEITFIRNISEILNRVNGHLHDDVLAHFLPDSSQLILQNKGNTPRMHILFALSPSHHPSRAIDASRISLKMAHFMTGCLVYPLRCCWKSKVSDDIQVTAANSVTLVVENDGSLEMYNREDTLQQERLRNITNLPGEEEKNSLILYHRDLRFVLDASASRFSELDINQRNQMNQSKWFETQQIIETEMESLESALRHCNILFDDENELHRRLSVFSEELRGNRVLNDMQSDESSLSITRDIQMNERKCNDVVYLEQELELLQQHEKTLMRTRDILRKGPDLMECFPLEMPRIEREIKKINDQKEALNEQIQKFGYFDEYNANASVLGNDVGTTIAVGDEHSVDGIQERSELDQYDQTLWELLYFALIFAPGCLFE